jgi:hypothetical protein
MGQTLAIWRWRPAWPFRSESRAVHSILNDRAPWALTRFDALGFAKELRRRFGEGEDALFEMDVCDFTGHRANWILLSTGWSTGEPVLSELQRLCTERSLHLAVAG